MNKEEAKEYAGKINYCLVPRRILTAVARIREYGNRKYASGGPDNWKKVEPARWREAAFRHFLAYLDDPLGMDEESGLPHLWHLACNIAFLCELDDPYMIKIPEAPAGVRSCRNCRWVGLVCAPCQSCRNFDKWDAAEEKQLVFYNKEVERGQRPDRPEGNV